MKIVKLDLLIAVYIACICLAETMGGKTFPLINLLGYQLNASVAIFLLPLIFTINDIIIEVYGPGRARSIIRSGLIIIAIILLFSLIAVALPPSTRFESTNTAYLTIFGISARISAASLMAFASAEFLDVQVFTKLRKKMGHQGLWLRNNLSNFIAQFFDTFIFMTLAFYAIDKGFTTNVSFLISLIVPYWLLKCFMSVLITPLVYWGRSWLQPDQVSDAQTFAVTP